LISRSALKHKNKNKLMKTSMKDTEKTYTEEEESSLNPPKAGPEIKATLGPRGAVTWAIGEIVWRGGFSHTFTTFDNPGLVNRTTIVVGSVCEILNGIPVLGAASIALDNIVPDIDKIHVRGNVGWTSDLRVRFSFMILNR
jgi:hypothetical protein